ncbi:hypothetical protein BU15DRAFT_78889 [Melanogaster broomeanus]|nr:hypothetical protein BU15DRAFT_78889 [Melanogaster broomeanus]
MSPFANIWIPNNNGASTSHIPAEDLQLRVHISRESETTSAPSVDSRTSSSAPISPPPAVHHPRRQLHDDSLTDFFGGRGQRMRSQHRAPPPYSPDWDGEKLPEYPICSELEPETVARHMFKYGFFAELKAKAEKAKDTGVTKMSNTRDRFSSVPASKTNWDPNWKRAPPPAPAPRGSASPSANSPPPPPPSRHRPDVSSAGSSAAPPPVVPRASRPDGDVSAPSHYTPLPPPTRSASGYPPSHREAPRDVVDEIDWANLSPEDREEFFGWLDEFFSRYLNVELGPREPTLPPSSARSVPVRPPVQHARPPPMVNMTTRPPVS